MEVRLYAIELERVAATALVDIGRMLSYHALVISMSWHVNNTYLNLAACCMFGLEDTRNDGEPNSRQNGQRDMWKVSYYSLARARKYFVTIVNKLLRVTNVAT
jgi:Ni/Fe-hydrogenase subunit HybB-like protein